MPGEVCFWYANSQVPTSFSDIRTFKILPQFNETKFQTNFENCECHWCTTIMIFE